MMGLIAAAFIAHEMHGFKVIVKTVPVLKLIAHRLK